MASRLPLLPGVVTACCNSGNAAKCSWHVWLAGHRTNCCLTTAEPHSHTEPAGGSWECGRGAAHPAHAPTCSHHLLCLHTPTTLTGGPRECSRGAAHPAGRRWGGSGGRQQRVGGPGAIFYSSAAAKWRACVSQRWLLRCERCCVRCGGLIYLRSHQVDPAPPLHPPVAA